MLHWYFLPGLILITFYVLFCFMLNCLSKYCSSSNEGLTECYHLNLLLEKRVQSRLNSQFIYLFDSTADSICYLLSQHMQVKSEDIASRLKQQQLGQSSSGSSSNSNINNSNSKRHRSNTDTKEADWTRTVQQFNESVIRVLGNYSLKLHSASGGDSGSSNIEQQPGSAPTHHNRTLTSGDSAAAVSDSSGSSRSSSHFHCSERGSLFSLVECCVNWCYSTQ